MPSLGDAVYCQPFVEAFATKIETRWPDLYPGVECGEGFGISPRYDSKSLALGSIPKAIGRFFPPLDDIRPTLPVFSKPSGKYAVIRPPTLRAKFYGPARNPRPEYIRRAAELLKGLGYTTVGIGNVRACAEWFDDDAPRVDEAYWGGLPIPELMGLISGASLIVAGPGYTVPASIAYDVPHVVIYGGAAKWNALDKLTDPRMGKVRLASVEPDRFCRACKTIRHDCDKSITDFDRKFANAADRALSM